MRQIFIGGTGRSGTTVLYNLLQTHERVFAFEKEMRFLVDYHGVLNLVDALTVNYSPAHSREGLFFFEQLMTKHLVNRNTAPYVGFDFEQLFGASFYRSRVKTFLDELSVGSFHGTDYTIPGSDLYNRFAYLIRKATRYHQLLTGGKDRDNRPVNLWPKREMKTAKYFPNRSELIEITSRFVDDLFANAAEKHGKSIWCEKTPSNLFHFDFLFELFPHAHFIHIKRDPRGVLQSMQNQFWADPSVEGGCLALKQMYQRWACVKASLPKEMNFLEMKLEDLATDYADKVVELTGFLGIDGHFVNPPQLELRKVDYWRQSMPAGDIKTVNDMLGDEIVAMGYSL